MKFGDGPGPNSWSLSMLQSWQPQGLPKLRNPAIQPVGVAFKPQSKKEGDKREIPPLIPMIRDSPSLLLEDKS